MPDQHAISAEKMEKYRTRLRGMRDRIGDEVERVVESIREELDPGKSNLSSVPVHLGDIAPEQLDADINVVEAERGMMEQIQAALHRIDQGTFGKCTDCGNPIAQERLQAIPYTPYCIRCANKRDSDSQRSSSDETDRF